VIAVVEDGPVAMGTGLRSACDPPARRECAHRGTRHSARRWAHRLPARVHAQSNGGPPLYAHDMRHAAQRRATCTCHVRTRKRRPGRHFSSLVALQKEIHTMAQLPIAKRVLPSRRASCELEAKNRGKRAPKTNRDESATPAPGGGRRGARPPGRPAGPPGCR
jgi:hypothetical protein